MFDKVSDQHIMGFNGPVTLNIDPVLRVMELMEIPDPLDCMEKVRIIYHAKLAKTREIAEANS